MIPSLLFIILLMDFERIYEITSTEVHLPTNHQQCPMKDTSHPSTLKAIMKLEYLRKKSRWKNSILVLDSKYAEYFFYQQEFFRNCLVKQSESNPLTKMVNYFGRSFVKGSYLKSYEYFCKNTTNSILKKHCDRVLRYNKVSKKVSWSQISGSNVEPTCISRTVKFEYAYEGHCIQRVLLKCPGIVQMQGVRNQDSGIFISLADDPQFNKSVVYVFSFVHTRRFLKMVALLINGEPFVE